MFIALFYSEFRYRAGITFPNQQELRQHGGAGQGKPWGGLMQRLSAIAASPNLHEATGQEFSRAPVT